MIRVTVTCSYHPFVKVTHTITCFAISVSQQQRNHCCIPAYFEHHRHYQLPIVYLASLTFPYKHKCKINKCHYVLANYKSGYSLNLVKC